MKVLRCRKTDNLFLLLRDHRGTGRKWHWIIDMGDVVSRQRANKKFNQDEVFDRAFEVMGVL